MEAAWSADLHTWICERHPHGYVSDCRLCNIALRKNQEREERTGFKLYIAGPMTGLPELNYPAFYKAEELLQSAGYEILNPAHNVNPDPTDYTEWIRLGLRQVLDANGIALLDGFGASRGAVLEIQVAHVLGIPIRTVRDWYADLSRMGAR